MNKYLIYIVLVLAVFCIGSTYTITKVLKENKRLNNNITAWQLDNARQLELKQNELKLFYGKQIDSLSKALNIKLKNVTNIIITKYNYRDTVIQHTTFDTVKIVGKETFNIDKECFKLNGLLDSTGLSIRNIELTDKLTTFIYKAYSKKFLFIKWKPYYTSKVYSECKKDTIQVQTNIKVLK